MKKSEKTFDCVKMKWEIQEKIAKEFKGMSEEKARKIQDERVTKNPIFGSLLEEGSRITDATLPKGRLILGYSLGYSCAGNCGL